ncbi:alpha/beta hydrolase family protein [Bacterioplanoides sp.]|uniref:alpha/beta hydrolase family protein n=1 Tax=Bacterioplanoides sp. TaxID=2066072 RepID=UPI003B5AA042
MSRNIKSFIGYLILAVSVASCSLLDSGSDLADVRSASLESSSPSLEHCSGDPVCLFDPTSKGIFPVGKRYKTYRHEVNGDVRELNSIIWFPAKHLVDRSPAEGVFPVVVYTHGFPSSKEEATYIYENLASHGFIVVSYDGPKSSMYSDVQDSQDIINAPLDIKFLISQLEQLSDDSQGDFYGRVNKQQIGVFGISYGAVISLLSAYVPPFVDERISFAVLVAPGPFPGITTADFGADRDIPLLYVQGTNDKLVSYEGVSQVTFKNAPAPKTFVGINGGTHLGYVEETKDLMGFAVNGHIDAILCALLEEEEDFDQTGCAVFEPSMSPSQQQDLLLKISSSFLRMNFGVFKEDQANAKQYFDRVLLNSNKELFRL